MKKTNEYKTIDLKIFTIDSDASQYEINQKINKWLKKAGNLLNNKYMMKGISINI